MGLGLKAVPNIVELVLLLIPHFVESRCSLVGTATPQTNRVVLFRFLGRYKMSIFVVICIVGLR
jgi:hypothetical protein